MLLVSTGFKSSILGPKGFVDLFNGGRIALFDTQRPSTPDAAPLGPPLGWITDAAVSGGGLQFILNGPYAIKRPGDRWSYLADFAGSVVWWRLVGPADDGTASFAQPRLDGDIGVAVVPAELTLTKLTFDAGETLDIDSFLYTIPPVAGL